MLHKLSTTMAGNKSLNAAMKAKNDEFYTQLADIENELQHYADHFRGRTVLCNCDDPRVSNFFHYFAYNFELLGLKKLITTCYKNQDLDLFSQNSSEKAIYLEYTGDKNKNGIPDAAEIGIKELRGDGDFRSPECIELLKEADIVVTNPPFSLFREYIAQLMHYGKKFIVIGNKNAITYKEIFPYIMSNEMWVGFTPMGKDLLFDVPEDDAKELLGSDSKGSKFRIVNGKVMRRSTSVWFTNLDIKKRHEKLILYKKYSPEEYPKFDFYKAINVNKVSDIPCDYTGAMGIPITFLDKYNPDQFEILDANEYRENDSVPVKPHGLIKDKDGMINGKPTYARILVKLKQI